MMMFLVVVGYRCRRLICWGICWVSGWCWDEEMTMKKERPACRVIYHEVPCLGAWSGTDTVSF